MRRIFLLISTAIVALSFRLSAKAEIVNLLPLPQMAEYIGNYLRLPSVKIDVPSSWADAYESQLEAAGVKCAASSKFIIKGEIDESLHISEINNDEAYTLEVSENGISIKSPSRKGIYWALQTLIQLIDNSDGSPSLPLCSITDWPAFSYRGYLMDVGRTFISMDELKREISNMSRFKLNVFHWHLTENQAWRLESNVYPQITDSINIIRQPGKYYTIEDAKEIQKFAADHNVVLIPELDMPGHSAAFQRAFGVDMQSEEGMKILKDLISEACETFDQCEYLHIGTDEVGFTNPDFVPEMVKFVRSKGKKAGSWHPGWKYKPGEIDMVTMWSYRGRPLAGTPSVDMRLHYINHFDTYADIRALYRSTVAGQTQGNDSIAGLALAIWNDRYLDDEQQIAIQNNLYPSLLAAAERGWDGGGSEYFDSLGVNMAPEGSDDFNAFKDFERRLLHHKATTLKDEKIPYVKQTDVKWRITDAFPNGGDLSAVFPPETEGTKLSYTYNDSVFNTREAGGAGIYLRHVWGSTVPAFYSDPKPDHTAYAYTWVYSPCDQTVGLQAETQNYSRSESDIPAPQGEWDFRKSRIWINDTPLEAPTWNDSHTVRDNEIPLGNENFSSRPPRLVNLKKGWNKVMLKLPIGKFSLPETRLNKWMFTFVFTTPDGSEAAPGLIYSPEKQLP